MIIHIRHCPEKQFWNNNNNKRTKNPEQDNDDEVAAAALIKDLLEAEDERPVKQRAHTIRKQQPGGRDLETIVRTTNNGNKKSIIVVFKIK